MSKRSRKRAKQLDTNKEPLGEIMQQLSNEVAAAQADEVGPAPTETPGANKPSPVLSGNLLSSVRDAALRAHHDTARNIAELESWRAEIDATIAFLRSQRK